MSEPNKNIPAAFRTIWSVQPLSYVYYLVLWGVPSKRSQQVLHDLLPGRSEDSIISIEFKVRAYITIKKSGEDKPGWMQRSFIKRMELASKMPVSSNIARFKEEGKGFKPAVFTGKRKGKAKGLITIEATPEELLTTSTSEIQEPESPFKQQKLVTPLSDAMDPKMFSSTSDPEEINKRVNKAKLASEEDHKKFVASQRAAALYPSGADSTIEQKYTTGRSELSVLEEIKALVTFARGLGATEVEYKDVKIKF